ncbi:hypothetical protein E8E01_18365 [Methylorubrum populi]|uniref:tyrosine-type recombinase/integrase n=1 Tax=Methylorubrum populi TaxID=223967 RepID=UPI001153D004|nr:hypothetical protein E8E01_18365 [Methylorubrum populi]
MPSFAAAKRWCPWLAAYSGARIAELTHLEKRDIRTESGTVVMDLRVTKTGEPQTVPLHAHLIELGFLTFVEASAPDPLFYDPKRHSKTSSTSPAELRGHKAGKWVRLKVKLDPGVDPNHGWRHTWKTRALAAGIEERLRDAITGHRVASVGRRYGTPSLSMQTATMKQFPRYDLQNSRLLRSHRLNDVQTQTRPVHIPIDVKSDVYEINDKCILISHGHTYTSHSLN